jgi:membrane associated rhomboid family serine protease
MALLWMALPVWRYVTGSEPESYASMIRSPMVFAAVALAVALLGRRTLLSNAFNRRVVATVILALVAQTLLNVGGALLAMPMFQTQLFGHFMGFCCAGVLAVTLVPRLLPAAIGYGAGFALTAARPDLHGIVSLVCNSVMALNAWLIWGRRAP